MPRPCATNPLSGSLGKANQDPPILPDRAKKMLTDAFLLTGLRVRRDVAARIFRGVRVMQESDTYLAILDEGQEKATREAILVVGEARLGHPSELIRTQLNAVTDLPRLKRMIRAAATA